LRGGWGKLDGVSGTEQGGTSNVVLLLVIWKKNSIYFALISVVARRYSIAGVSGSIQSLDSAQCFSIWLIH